MGRREPRRSLFFFADLKIAGAGILTIFSAWRFFCGGSWLLPFERVFYPAGMVSQVRAAFFLVFCFGWSDKTLVVPFPDDPLHFVVFIKGSNC